MIISMGKRGPKPKYTINTEWNANLAYAVGLLATDGCLGRDGLWIDLTSKDKEQLQNYNHCLGTKVKIGIKNKNSNNRAWRVQMKNRNFYDFLVSIGFTPRKSMTINKILIPKKYFFDFLRGCLDGDGYTFSYWDPRWKSSFMIYTGFVSASKPFLIWIQEEIFLRLQITGHITNAKKKNIYYQLKYAKYDSLKLLKSIYASKDAIFLKRKRLKIDKTLATIGWSLTPKGKYLTNKRAGGETGTRTTLRW